MLRNDVDEIIVINFISLDIFVVAYFTYGMFTL